MKQHTAKVKRYLSLKQEQLTVKKLRKIKNVTPSYNWLVFEMLATLGQDDNKRNMSVTTIAGNKLISQQILRQF